MLKSWGRGGVVTSSPKVPGFCSRLAWSFFKTCDWLVFSFLNADWPRKDQASLEQKTGTFGDGVWWVVAHKILETAQRPNSSFHFYSTLGLDFGLGLGLVNYTQPVQWYWYKHLNTSSQGMQRVTWEEQDIRLTDVVILVSYNIVKQKFQAIVKICVSQQYNPMSYDSTGRITNWTTTK